MNHTRYMVDNVTICEEPARLNLHELIVGDYSEHPEMLCRECSALLAAHNKREYEKEQYASMSIVQNPHIHDVDPNHWDVFIGGLALATGFWVTFFAILWGVFLR